VPISHAPNALVVADNVSGLTPSPLSAEDFATVSISD
jgi:peptide/nickel transport system substrate-binding protein